MKSAKKTCYRHS